MSNNIEENTTPDNHSTIIIIDELSEQFSSREIESTPIDGGLLPYKVFLVVGSENFVDSVETALKGSYTENAVLEGKVEDVFNHVFGEE